MRPVIALLFPLLPACDGPVKAADWIGFWGLHQAEETQFLEPPDGVSGCSGEVDRRQSLLVEIVDRAGELWLREEDDADDLLEADAGATLWASRRDVTVRGDLTVGSERDYEIRLDGTATVTDVFWGGLAGGEIDRQCGRVWPMEARWVGI